MHVKICFAPQKHLLAAAINCVVLKTYTSLNSFTPMAQICEIKRKCLVAPFLGRIFTTPWHWSHHFEPKDFLFSLPNFFPLSTFGKISFQAEYLSANFTVINATQISKFEREGRSSKYPLPTRGFFRFPSSFPTNDKEDCFIVSCACPSYLYSNKEKQKLETGSRSNGAPRIFLLSTFITCFLGLWTDKIQ